MTADDWAQLRADPENVATRNRLVDRYMWLVEVTGRALAKRLPETIELGDLLSVGVIGLIKAIGDFDPGRGVKFETFGTFRIRGAMLDEMRETDWVPRLTRVRERQLRVATEQLTAQLCRPPTSIELADHLGLSLGEFRELERKAGLVKVGRLGRPRPRTHNTLDSVAVDGVVDPRGEDPTLRLRSQDFLRSVTRGLNRQERLVVILYYFELLTMKEIGAALGVCETRISQIRADVIERLRRVPREFLTC